MRTISGGEDGIGVTDGHDRRNAQHSTGPKTAEGKAASRRNALRHGLTAEQIVIFDESAEDYAAFAGELRTAYGPADAAEEGLVERITHASWRLRRVWRVEAAAIDQEAVNIGRERARAAAREAMKADYEANTPSGKANEPAGELRHAIYDIVAGLSDDQLEALNGMYRAKPEPRPGEPRPGEAQPGEARPDEPREARAAVLPAVLDVAIWPARLNDLSRYEAALERALGRATRELERRQARRRVEERAAADAEKARAAAAGRAAAIAEAVARREREAAEAPESDPSYRATVEYAKRSQLRGAPPPQTGRAADPPPR